MIWSRIKQFAGLMGSGSSLDSIVSILMPIAKRKSFKSCIGKLTLAAAAYFVWQERNFRLFKHSKRLVQEVVDCIMSSVRLKLLSCRFKKSKDAVLFSRLWELLPVSPMSCHIVRAVQAGKKDTLWVRWIHERRLKGRNLWNVSSDAKSSWSWKNLLELRPRIQKHMIYKVGNGESISIWHDKWHSIGPLYQFLSNRDVYEATFKNSHTTADLIHNGAWRCQVDWYAKFTVLNQVHAPTLNNDASKRWDTMGNKKG
ncbi:hypothetical protein Tco_1063347 [Tanacetum coccineum]